MIKLARRVVHYFFLEPRQVQHTSTLRNYLQLNSIYDFIFQEILF